MTTDLTSYYDVLIAGQGAAGFAAALYSARYQMRTIVLGDTFGGETATGGNIENYPGFPEIDGFELMMKFPGAGGGVRRPGRRRERGERRVRRPPVPLHDVRGQRLHVHRRGLVGGQGASKARAGARGGSGPAAASPSARRATRPFTAATSSPPWGGGNAAVEGAILLGKYARQVYIIYRRDSFARPEPVTLRLLAEADNVRPLFNTSVVELKGTDGLDGVVLDRPVDGATELALDGLFIEIGADPRVELPNQLGLELNAVNEVTVDKTMRTNVPGVLAAGDLTNASGDLKQTITAAAQGRDSGDLGLRLRQRARLRLQDPRGGLFGRLNATDALSSFQGDQPDRACSLLLAPMRASLWETSPGQTPGPALSSRKRGGNNGGRAPLMAAGALPFMDKLPVRLLRKGSSASNGQRPRGHRPTQRRTRRSATAVTLSPCSN